MSSSFITAESKMIRETPSLEQTCTLALTLGTFEAWWLVNGKVSIPNYIKIQQQLSHFFTIIPILKRKRKGHRLWRSKVHIVLL